jgi:polyhydroxyalkanoate synthesis repressor PhaR
MPVIKRYANRKLYDTEARRYVTLDDLADFIRKGEDVRVVDHVTGDDLTSITLLQVIFEEQKKIGGLMPQVLLTRLIRAGGNTMNDLWSRVSALDPFKVVDEEIHRRLKALVESGKLSEEEASRLRDLLLRQSAQADVVHIPVKADETVGAEEKAPVGGVIGLEEVGALLRQVDMLEEELAALKARRT